MKKVCLIILTVLFYFPLLAQNPAYKISINLDGYQDSVAYLGNYFGDKLAIADTAFTKKGNILFTGTDPLKQGVYFLVSQDKKKLFEFLIGDDQFFEIEKAFMGPPQDVQFNGSDENILFYSYLEYNRESYLRLQELRSETSVIT